MKYALSQSVIASFLLLTQCTSALAATSASGISLTKPNLLTYNELLQVAQQPEISAPINKKIQVLLNTPFIYRNANTTKPALVSHPQIGDSIRVAAWNIERGFHVNEIIQLFEPTTPDLLLANTTADPEAKTTTTTKPQAPGAEEQEWLSKSQILILTEVDHGMGRTQYKDITRLLAEKLNMNAAYGVEFLELGPLSKRLRQYAEAHGNHLQIAGKEFNINPAQYKGLHGSAVLSRYPILNAQMIRLPQCYDWLKGEQKKLSELEKVKRTMSDKVFQEVMLTEVRKGGRMAMAVDLSIPELPEKKATVVVAHLENRCQADCRQKQIAFLLNSLKGRKNPIVIGGDFNTSGADASPTSVKKEIRERIEDPAFWTRNVISLLVPFGYIANAGITVSKYTKNYHNPATPNIPLILPNPEYDFFKLLKDFQFSDGHVLDLRGEDANAYQHRGGFMANSNQRALKGFVPTFSFERPLFKGFVGTYKLDWFLVKDYLQASTTDNEKQNITSYRFAPSYARTLREINKIASPDSKKTENRLSDHDPITIDLPLTEGTSQPQAAK